MSDHAPRPAEILLVEDEPGDVYLVREAFKDFPCTIHVAEDGGRPWPFSAIAEPTPERGVRT